MSPAAITLPASIDGRINDLLNNLEFSSRLVWPRSICGKLYPSQCRNCRTAFPSCSEGSSRCPRSPNMWDEVAVRRLSAAGGGGGLVGPRELRLDRPRRGHTVG